MPSLYVTMKISQTNKIKVIRPIAAIGIIKILVANAAVSADGKITKNSEKGNPIKPDIMKINSAINVILM